MGGDDGDWLLRDEAIALVRSREPMSIGRAEAIVDEVLSRKCKEVRKKPPHIDHSVYLIGDDGLSSFDMTPGAKATRPPWIERPRRISRDDLLYWLDRNMPAPAAPAQPKQRSNPRRSEAKEIIDLIWPDGIPPHLENALICKEVGKRLKTALSDDTILRAAGRKAK